jgi:mRNA interferase RelE/StbE
MCPCLSTESADTTTKRIGLSFLDTEPEYGYNLAIMRREIIFAPEAVEDLKGLSARDRSIIRAAIEGHLRHEAEQISKSRIKRLRGLSQPQYRLRVEGFRVFYDVSHDAVEVLAMVPKSGTAAWLDEMGKAER